MDSPPPEWSASPGPWAFEKHVYGLAHCLLDRDGRVIGSHLALPNGPLMAEAPAMVALLRDLVAGGSVETLQTRAAAILRPDRSRPPARAGEDDE
jgi:hypothetical protein